MEHNLVPLVHGVDGVGPCGVICKTQTCTGGSRAVWDAQETVSVCTQSAQSQRSVWTVHLRGSNGMDPARVEGPRPPCLSLPAARSMRLPGVAGATGGPPWRRERVTTPCPRGLLVHRAERTQPDTRVPIVSIKQGM